MGFLDGRVKIAVASLLLVFSLAPAYAVCRLGLLDQQRMDHLDGMEPGLGRFNKGLLYYDRNCLSEALAEFGAAVHVLENEASRSLARDQLLGLSRTGLNLTSAVRLLATDRNAGIAALFEVANKSAPSQLSLRCVLVLATALNPTAPEWDALETDLEILANTGYWKARQLLVRRLIAQGQGGAAALSVERLLGKCKVLQEAHALRILLAETYFLTERSLEAWILIRSQDSEAGAEILDWELRIEYLRVAASIAKERALQGDVAASQILAIYETAQREVQAP